MNRILIKDGKVLISDPLKNEKDDTGTIDRFMRVKKDGHIQFYSPNELDELFIHNGFAKEHQVITNMKFPFAQQAEYLKVYDQTSDQDRSLYAIKNDNGIIWVQPVQLIEVDKQRIQRSRLRGPFFRFSKFPDTLPVSVGFGIN